jgi:hypothetical protein
MVAASKETVVDYRPPAPTAKIDPYAIAPFPHTYAGMLVTIDRRGLVSAPKLLDSGSNVYVDALAAGPGGEILLGGGLGGQAAIFHLGGAASSPQ